MKLPEAVHKNEDLHNVDSRMTRITDLYPTSLSVIGEEPEAYMTGRALAGEFEDTRPPREMMFSLLARAGPRRAWKSFAAYTKESFYQTNLINLKSIQEREELDIEGETAMLLDAYEDSLYLTHHQFFAVAPLFSWLRMLMRVNALDPAYLSKYYFLAADDARPPSEVLFDFGTDPYGTENLLMDYIYSVGQGEAQKWGNTITNVTLEYGDLDEGRLSTVQKSELSSLREGLADWIQRQEHVSEEVDWTDELFGEENKMAELFWPSGIQPITSDVVVGSPFFGDAMATSDLSCETEGTVFRYAAVTASDRAVCEKLGAANKAQIAVMSPTNTGLMPIQYTSLRSHKSYTGFYYGEDVDLVSRSYVGSTMVPVLLGYSVHQ
jgi:hypothetical protein